MTRRASWETSSSNGLPSSPPGCFRGDGMRIPPPQPVDWLMYDLWTARFQGPEEGPRRRVLLEIVRNLNSFVRCPTTWRSRFREDKLQEERIEEAARLRAGA